MQPQPNNEKRATNSYAEIVPQMPFIRWKNVSCNGLQRARVCVCAVHTVHNCNYAYHAIEQLLNAKRLIKIMLSRIRYKKVISSSAIYPK